MSFSFDFVQVNILYLMWTYPAAEACETGKTSSIYCFSGRGFEFYFVRGGRRQGRGECRGILALCALGNLDPGSCLCTGNTWSLNKQTSVNIEKMG